MKSRERMFSVLSVGAFLIIVAVIFLVTPNLLDRVITFFQLDSWSLTSVPNVPYLKVPALIVPRLHSDVFQAVFHFCLVWGGYEAAVLALRLAVRSSSAKIGETASNIVFWFGTSFLVNMFLNDSTTVNMWFEFWALLVVMFGLSLIVRAAVHALSVAVRPRSYE